MSKTVTRRVQCPYCGQFRLIRCNISSYLDGMRACRSCATMVRKGNETENPGAYVSKRVWASWDHDPWETGQLGWNVTTNALLDGWNA